jgi:hypothetical protein
MKKIALIVTTLMITLGIFACNTSSTNTVFEENSDIYAFSAISSVDLLSTSQVQTTGKALSILLADNVEPIVSDQLDELNKYLNMMEKFLGDGNRFSFVEEISDHVEYTHKIVFSSVDIAGESVVYIFYFNEALLDEVSETSMTDLSDTTIEPDEDEEDEKDEDEFENQETSISGLLVIGTKEYAVSGKKEIEENEQKIEIRSEIDELNFVEVISKVEGGERKFQYTVSVDGIVTQTEVKIEQEDNEQKIELKFLAGEAKGEYTFKQETEDGETILKIEYKIENDGVFEEGEIKVLVVVDPVTGETTYNYYIKSDDGKEAEVEKDRDEYDNEEENETEETGYNLA